MAKIWKEGANIDEHPNRNNFDLRYQNHLTMKMGGIYPIMAKECVPGDSFTIDTAFGLKFMPLVFPVQSHMKAHISYFYVPNRILWDNWKNFISGLEEHEHPYISQPTGFFTTGSLADYLDIPTTIVGVRQRTAIAQSYDDGFSLTYRRPRRSGTQSVNTDGNVTVTYSGLYSHNFNPDQLTAIRNGATPRYVDCVDTGSSSNICYEFLNLLNPLIDDTDFSFEVQNCPTSTIYVYLVFWRNPREGSVDIGSNSLLTIVAGGQPGTLVSSSATDTNFASFVPDSNENWVNLLRQLRSYQDAGDSIFLSLVTSTQTYSNFPAAGCVPTKNSQTNFTGRFRYNYEFHSVDNVPETPFANDIPDSGGEPLVRINALPFRAYEAIYWSYFSNTQNQPFYVNGTPVYNKWNTTTSDGADTTYYHLFRRNYEMDFLTSSMPSPQFGVAPLVGMTALGNITIEDENGISTYHATVDNDGTITKVVATSPTASIEHARTAMNIAQVGMNINDFRATNSFQRFLETTLRKGYRYKDFIMGHHGVDVKQIELDMPVYIGGVSQDVSVNMVSNMSAGQSMSDGQPIPLGEFAGTANCFGQSKNTITHYCDDYGWIIGVLTVVPDPAYSQLLPKHFLHDKQMSYYFNEFAQNGMQPITYKEVTPLTAYQDYLVDNNKLLTDTFGYQRPNYDLVGYTDQVHGLFRTELKDFLIHRIFSHRPELGTEFLEIDPREVNDIFAYRNADSDTILGQIIVDIKAKRPVPRVVVPSLGR